MLEPRHGAWFLPRCVSRQQAKEKGLLAGGGQEAGPAQSSALALGVLPTQTFLELSRTFQRRAHASRGRGAASCRTHHRRPRMLGKGVRGLLRLLHHPHPHLSEGSCLSGASRRAEYSRATLSILSPLPKGDRMVHVKQDLSLKQNDPHFVPTFSEEFPAGTGRQVGLGTSCFPKGHRVAPAGLPRAQASCKHKYCASAPNLRKNRPVISTEPCLTTPGGWMFTEGPQQDAPERLARPRWWSGPSCVPGWVGSGCEVRTCAFPAQARGTSRLSAGGEEVP